MNTTKPQQDADNDAADRVPKKSTRASVSGGEAKTPKKGKAVFVDAKAMKDKLREHMHKPRYDVKNFYWETGLCQQVARDSLFENTTLAVIGVNAMWIAVDCDHNHESVLTEAHPVFIAAENLFCTFFSIELAFRFGAFKNKLNCFKDAWFLFDSFMVAMMVFETWIMMVFILVAGGGGASLGNAGMLRLLRLLRLSRMARMARLLRSMPELLVLIKGMIAAIRSVFFTLLLLFLLLYVFSILFRQLTTESTIGEEKFPTILISAQTLVLDGILFDGPGDLMAMMEEESMYILIVAYYFFVLFAALTVMNMLIGVLCEVVSATAATETEELTIVYVQERLESIVFRCLEMAGGSEIHSVKIGKSDFLTILQDEEATQLLMEVAVDVFGLVDLVDTIFATETGDERILEFGDLIEVFMDQRTSNTATVKDVTDLRKYVRGRLDRMDKDVEINMAAIGSMLESTGRLGQGTFEYELTRRRKVHNLTTDELPPRPEPANPEVVPEVFGSAAEMQATPEEVPLPMQTEPQIVDEPSADYSNPVETCVETIMSSNVIVDDSDGVGLGSTEVAPLTRLNSFEDNEMSPMAESPTTKFRKNKKKFKKKASNLKVDDEEQPTTSFLPGVGEEDA